MTNFESNDRYLISWSKELTSRANRVRDLIGNRHWLSDGQHKEAIVRDLLSRFLPPTSCVGSGFVKSVGNGLVSNELDIMISDLCKHPSYFNEGGIQIIFPESLVAMLEVKSSFTTESLDKALNLTSNLGGIVKDINHSVWRCILFVDINESFDKFIDLTKSKIEQLMMNFNSSGYSNNVIEHHLPTCISSFNKYSLFIKFNLQEKEVRLSYFDTSDYSASIAFSDLFDSVYQHFNDGSQSPLSDLIIEISSNFKNKMEVLKYDFKI